MIIVEYETNEERDAAIVANSGHLLIEEHNHTDGNYLVFDDSPFDLSLAELRAILKIIIDQFNAVRANAGMPLITYEQARDAIKAELRL